MLAYHPPSHFYPSCAGHVHAYERTYPTYNYNVDQCGMRWLVMGDGGNIEGLYKTFAAQPSTCPCTPVNNDTYSNGCPCQDVSPSTLPAVRTAAVHFFSAKGACSVSCWRRTLRALQKPCG